LNYRGSYKKLLGNATAAMVAAVEIYNKPTFPYRDECFVVLLLNAWELLLKAIVSKKGRSIYYPKKRKEAYKTLSWKHAFGRAVDLIPRSLSPRSLELNLEFLSEYRDNAVHFYNSRGFETLVYGLAQTCIRNFRDVVDSLFGVRLEDRITWQVLPLGIRPPIDPIAYMARVQEPTSMSANSEVKVFLNKLARAVADLEATNEDTGRLLTVFQVKLESTKKIASSDFTVRVAGEEVSTAATAIIRPTNPNITHPLRRKDVVAAIPSLHGRPFTKATFTAIAWKYRLKKEHPHLCWAATEGVLVKYSHDVVVWLKRLSVDEVDAAVREYREHLCAQLKQRKTAAAA